MEPYVTKETIDTKTLAWLKHVDRVNKRGLKINKDKSALLVVDMQNYFLDASSPAFTCGGPAILPSIIKLISAFRFWNRPVIYTKHVHHPGGIDAGIMQWWWEGMCIEGSPESGIHKDILPLEHEKIVLKHRYSAFFNTDLDTVLRCLKIEDLVITGVMTNMCCESTARDAYFRDYRVFFPADGTGSVNEEMHKASLLNLAYGFAQITTAGSIIEQLQN